MHSIAARRQGGFTLVEVLVAFLVLTLGLLAVIRVQPALRQHAELARQRSEATRLAQQDIEGLRSFVQIGIAGTAPAYDAIVAAGYAVEPDALGSPRYAVERRVDAVSIPNARAIDVTVRWLDRAGEPQQARLTTLIAASDPSLAAAILLPR